MIKVRNTNKGFTLIEMIVSLGIFSIIITTAIGALLVLISGNQKLQNEQGVMSNLAFALDSMTREIRTGYNYYCDAAPNYNSGGSNNIFDNSDPHETIVGVSTQDCSSGRSPASHNLQGVSFFEGGNSITGTSTSDRRILYYFDNASSTIMRRVGNDSAQSIISSGLQINEAEFFVTGSQPLSVAAAGGGLEQPTVTIRVEAQEIGEPKIYYLQTSVTQRTLDL